MKLTNKRTISFLFVIILISFRLNSASLISKGSKYNKNNNENSHKNIDMNFLASVNNLKNFMVTKQGASFKELGLKFITKDNRYVIANENIPVSLVFHKGLNILFLLSIINFINSK